MPPNSTDERGAAYSVSVPDVKVRETNEVARIIDNIVSLTDRLAALPDLKPCQEVNELFSSLVSICIERYSRTVSTQVLSSQRIELLAPRLRRMCSDGEAELERFWARDILRRANEHLDDSRPPSVQRAENLLRSFPYYSNYNDLSELEVSNILTVLSPPLLATVPFSLAFIGSGPLPLTSFIFHDVLRHVTIRNIDSDASAIDISAQLAYALGFDVDGRMKFQHACATSCGSLEDFDVVCLAALVGMDEVEKKSILSSVSARMKVGALLCVRSAVSLRGLLYPAVEFDEEIASFGLQMVLELHPWNHVVNSTLIMKSVGGRQALNFAASNTALPPCRPSEF